MPIETLALRLKGQTVEMPSNTSRKAGHVVGFSYALDALVLEDEFAGVFKSAPSPAERGYKVVPYSDTTRDRHTLHLFEPKDAPCWIVRRRDALHALAVQGGHDGIPPSIEAYLRGEAPTPQRQKISRTEWIIAGSLLAAYIIFEVWMSR
jgi:hypothetical protein